MNPRVLLPIAVLAAALLVAAVLVVTGEPIASRPTERAVRAVRVSPVEIRDVELSVSSQGTVSPRTESELVPEVSGRVVWTSPALVSGGYFQAGDVLLRIDRADYVASVERARAALERAQGEHVHARETLTRQQDLATGGVASDAALDEAVRSDAVTSASVREARVALDQAERDLERTELRAPFSGRVREERVDVGQFLNRGQSYATIYATDAVEVRLPIADGQLAFLDLPIWQRGAVARADGEMPPVTLRARFAGAEHEWRGRVVRTEGEIDARSRFVHVVARVENDEASGQPPLPVGLFVQARIGGRRAHDVAVIPRSAVHEGRVLLVDADDRLRFRAIDVMRIERDDAYVSGGLQEGERVCVSAIAAPVDGMRVRPVESEPPRGGPDR